MDENDFENSISVAEVKENAERINKVIAEEIKVLNGNSKRVFIGGFS